MAKRDISGPTFLSQDEYEAPNNEPGISQTDVVLCPAFRERHRHKNEKGGEQFPRRSFYDGYEVCDHGQKEECVMPTAKAAFRIEGCNA
jgi:hypothetical protein